MVKTRRVRHVLRVVQEQKKIWGVGASESAPLDHLDNRTIHSCIPVLRATFPDFPQSVHESYQHLGTHPLSPLPTYDRSTLHSPFHPSIPSTAGACWALATSGLCALVGIPTDRLPPKATKAPFLPRASSTTHPVSSSLLYVIFMYVCM